MRRLVRFGCLVSLVTAGVAPGIAAEDAGVTIAEQAEISIDVIGGLPRFFADDIRLQWIVPGDAGATDALRELEYAVVEVETNDGLRRTFIARQLIDDHRLVHHYFFYKADSARSATVRMDIDLLKGAAIELAGQPGFIPEQLPGFGAAYGSVRSVAVGPRGQRTLKTGEDDVESAGQDPQAGDWFGVRNRFWTSLLRSAAMPLTIEVDAAAENLPQLVVRPPENNARLTLDLYAGPIDVRTLALVDSMLKGMMFAALWDWLRVLCFGLLWILSVLYGLVGDMGLAIILLSLCVKVLMSPLTLIADRLQDSVNKTLALLQPQIDAIKQEYKGEEAHERVLAIYKKHDVHPMYPMKSLVGFLIQIPIFIAAFDMLGENIALSGTEFLWIEDLAKPDRWLSLPVTVPFFGGHLNLLPCIMTGVTLLTSWIQTDSSLTPALLHKQRIRLYLMAGAFFMLFYTFPAGMVLYWTTNNVLHLAKIQLAGLIGRIRRR